MGMLKLLNSFYVVRVILKYMCGAILKLLNSYMWSQLKLLNLFFVFRVIFYLFIHAGL